MFHPGWMIVDCLTKTRRREIIKFNACIFYLVVVLVFFCLPFSAKAEKEGFYSTLKGGVYCPDSDDLEDFDDEFSGEFALGYYFNRNFALELGLGLMETEDDYRGYDAVLGNIWADADLDIIPLTLSAKGVLPVNKQLDLFGLAGIGVYFSDIEIDYVTTGPLGNFKYEDSDESFGLHLGLGGNYNITERLFFGIEGKYFWTEAEYEDTVLGVPIDLDVDLDGFVVFAGLTYFFGDQPVVAAEPVSVDSDGDGVHDDKDRCPGTPSGVRVDGFGCPLDSDGDGVYDQKDKCPKTPKGASVNEFGCWVCKNVNFDVNQATIRPKSYKNLDEQVSFLKRNPDLIVEVQGHTDSTGSREYNQALSEKRANAVRDYIIQKGIAED